MVIAIFKNEKGRKTYLHHDEDGTYSAFMGKLGGDLRTWKTRTADWDGMEFDENGGGIVMNHIIKMALLSRLAKAEDALHTWEQADSTYWNGWRNGMDVETGARLEQDNERTFHAFIDAADAFEALATKHGMTFSLMERVNFNPENLRKRINAEMWEAV